MNLILIDVLRRKPNEPVKWMCLSRGVCFAGLLSHAERACDVSASLETVCGIYQQHTPENFDDCGEISHYSGKIFVVPQATIARTRPSEVFPFARFGADFGQVETESPTGLVRTPSRRDCAPAGQIIF